MFFIKNFFFLKLWKNFVRSQKNLPSNEWQAVNLGIFPEEEDGEEKGKKCRVIKLALRTVTW